MRIKAIASIHVRMIVMPWASLIKIATDNPKAEQWKLLGQFAYPKNIARFLKERGVTANDETVNFIAGCLQQSSAYFSASESAPLDISPLLLYYGATNLLSGVSAMLTNARPQTKHHGMQLYLPHVAHPRIGDFEVRPCRPLDGALQHFCNVFSDGCAITNGGSWTVKELLGSVPDLVHDFENCYEGDLSYCIPVKIMRGKKKDIEFVYERIAMPDLDKYPSPQDAIELIADLKNAYLTPRFNIPSESVPLYYKEPLKEIGTYSIFGKKYLRLVHLKNGQRLSPSQIILMFMGLYALGYLSRYYPESWNPFVRSDSTGERLVIEKYMDICRRYLPNLILNEIRQARIQFVYEVEEMF
jgi:hypothetical protein